MRAQNSKKSNPHQSAFAGRDFLHAIDGGTPVEAKPDKQKRLYDALDWCLNLEIDHRHKIVLTYLVRHCDGAGKLWHKQSTMATALKMQRTSVTRSIRFLARRGYVSLERRGKGKKLYTTTVAFFETNPDVGF